MNGWSETREGTAAAHRRALKQNVHAGGGNTSEPILGESLALIASTWLAETTGSDELGDRIAGTFTIHHHMLGVVGQNASPYIDMPMNLVSLVSGENDPEKESAGFFSGSGHASAMEWGVIDQLQPNSAVSTVKLIDLSNSLAQRIFDATLANYFSVVRPQLTNYNSFELSYVEGYINAGFRVLLPQDGNLGEQQWSGIGFLAISPGENQIGHVISGGLKGGYGVIDWVLGGFDLFFEWLSWHPVSIEPIDLVTGDYLSSRTDLTVGSGPFPFSLEFERSYNSGARLDAGPLGLGWTHNFDIRVDLGSDGFEGLGKDSPIDAAAAIVQHFVALDLLSGAKTKERVVAATLAHRWMMDQLLDNLVTVRQGGETNRFQRMPDGSYNPPPGMAATLTKEADETYLLRWKHGELLDFDAQGKIATWQDTSGNTVTFSYSGGNLQSVANGLTRTLTFAYTSNRLTQVSDGNGRSFAYGYDAAGNLTTVTNATSNTTTFEYSSPGSLSKIFYPSRPTTAFVTNTFDPLGRVETQTDGNGNTYRYHFSGLRAEEVDPLGESKVWNFDDRGRAVRERDALGNETRKTYDGHSRLVAVLLPEGNSTQYEYDASHNLSKETMVPKPASTEQPIVHQYTYEPVFNRMTTFVDPLLRTTNYVYDARGLLQRVDHPTVPAGTPQTTLVFNARGQLELLTDPTGRSTRRTYGSVTGDLLSTIVDPGGLSLTTSMTRDAIGDIQARTNPRGYTTAFQYDAMRRVTRVTTPPPLSFVTRIVYDADGRLVTFEKETRQPGPAWQTTSVTYTTTGQQSAVTDPEGNTMIRQYDALDRVWKIIDAEGRTIERHYDDAGRLQRIIDAEANVALEMFYTPNGLVETVADPNGIPTQWVYDDFDRVDRIVYPDSSYEEFTYDAAGNSIQKRVRSGQVITYTYDALDRLTQKTLPGPSIQQYAYDLSRRLVDAIDEAGTIHHTYDGAGRVTGVAYPGAETSTISTTPRGTAFGSTTRTVTSSPTRTMSSIG